MMESAMDPIHHQIRSHEKDRRLQPKRQLRQRPMTVVVELDQSLGTGDPEYKGGSENQEPDAQVAREQRDQEPIAKIGEEIAFMPPRLARVAGTEERQEAEGGPQRNRYRHDLDEGDADTVDDC